MDTEAIASEIVSLKNRIADLGDDRVEEKGRLLERLRSLQDQLSGRSAEDHDPDSSAFQYIKPS